MDGDVVVGRADDPCATVPELFSDAVSVPTAGSPPSPLDEGVSSVPVAGSPGDGVSSVVGRFRSWLASVDTAGLTDREQVDLVAELERVKGAASAAQARATDALRISTEASAARDAGRSVGSQVALARQESPALGDRFVGLSRALVHEMPCTMAALTRGVIAERHAVAAVQATAALSQEHRGEVDTRLAGVLGRLGVQQLGRAATRVAAELDAASVVARMEAAVRSRRVSLRPAPDGMAYLSVLGPLKDVVGAHAALVARSRRVVGGQCPEEAPEGRGLGAVAADTALQVLSGRAVGQVQPVEVHLVMTDRSLLGTGDVARSAFEPARIPGHGSVPAPVARTWLREEGQASVWLRRVYTTPSGRDLVAMDSRRRVFPGLLRRMLVLRDDVCVTPWCGAPVVHADHTVPVHAGGVTSWVNGDGRCARCNHVKETPGWSVTVTSPGPQLTVLPGDASTPSPDARSVRSRRVTVLTPNRHVYASSPPPLLGWGSEDPAAGEPPVRVTDLDARGVRVVHAPAGKVDSGRKPQASGTPPMEPFRGTRRGAKTRPSSRLERQFCRYLC